MGSDSGRAGKLPKTRNRRQRIWIIALLWYRLVKWPKAKSDLRHKVQGATGRRILRAEQDLQSAG